MPDVDVGVPFVKQETLFYCGPAVVEMVLRTLKAASPATPPTWQDQLWDLVKANTGASRPASAPSSPSSPAFPTQKCEMCAGAWSCWSTTPGVLEYLLNTGQGSAIYAISQHVTEAAATAALLDALDANLPGVALVRGWQHWLVVDGYRHSEPNGWAVAGRSVNGVFIRDPLDVAATHYIKTSKWRSDYLRFVPCGAYQNTFVVAGAKPAPTPPPPPPQQPPQAPTGVRIVDPRREPRPVWPGAGRLMLPILEAIRRGAAAAAEVAGSGRLQPAFDGAQPRSAVLVQRLDQRDAYYYIVSFVAESGESARVIIDAFDGEFEEAIGVLEKGQTLPQYLPPGAALDRLHADPVRDEDARRPQPRTGTVGQHPVLVWKPCKESTSPFLPFYQFSVGDRFVYYRVDGPRFEELTEGPA